MKRALLKLFILMGLLVSASQSIPARADIGGGIPPVCYPIACPNN